MSSWTFNLKPGDKVRVFGPFGEFFAKKLMPKWYLWGWSRHGSMRAHIFDQLLRINSDRKISFGMELEA